MAKSKPFFEPVDPHVDFPKMEREILGYWNKKDIVNKYLQKNRNSKKRFSFLDGPITANNPMGVHHAWGRTYKDLWQRFYNMQGYRQRFQNGFDCQGLWVEVEVEKELGLRSKRDIENLVEGDVTASIAKFVELCKERVFKFARIQTEQSKRLGYFMDWDNSYYTLSDENNYMIWHFLKKCHDYGLIYKGRDSVPWCPRCGTAISQHEMLTEDYKEVIHETVFFKLPVKNRDFSLLVWTTTPWTIPANVAVAVNSKFNYRVWLDETTGEKIIFIREDSLPKRERNDDYNEDKKFLDSILQGRNWRGVTDFKGSELVGLRYKGPFDELDRVKKAQEENPRTFHTVVNAEGLVVATKGTGILHVAPGAGEEDFKLGQEKKLPVIDVIGEEANYYDGMGEFSGKNAKKHPEIIIEYLKNKNAGKFLLKTSNIKHRYPACWRCKTELVWRVVDEWYIAMDKSIASSKLKVKQSLAFQAKNSKQNTLRKVMMEVAKKINWIPEFGLERELDWLANMHDWLISKKRYWGLTLPIWECAKCGHYEVIGNKEELKKRAVNGWDKFNGHSPHRPWVDEVKIKCAKCGNIVSRIPDVGNPWLDAGIVPYSTLTKKNIGKPLYLEDKSEWNKWFPADFITESFPGQFKNWFYAMIAESTVLENKEPFKTVLGFATLLAENGKAMHKSLGNAIEFNGGADRIGVDVMRWMYARQNPEDNLLFGYTKADETRRRFHLKIWNIYNFFVTYANIDGWKSSITNNSKLITKNILDRWIISRLNQTIKSVTQYLKKYDAFRSSEAIEEFVDDFSNWYIRRSRDRVGPTAEDNKGKKLFYDTTFYTLTNLCVILSPFTPFITDVIFRNLKKEESVHLSSWPKLNLNIDANLIKQMKVIREIVEIVHGQRKQANIPVRQPLQSISVKSSDIRPNREILDLLLSEVNVKEIKWIKGRKTDVVLNKKITKLLEEEGKARELVRKIQNERRNIGIVLTQKVLVSSPWIPKNKEVMKWVLGKTLTRKLDKGKFSVTVNFKHED